MSLHGPTVVVSDPVRLAQQWLDRCRVFVADSEEQLRRARVTLAEAERRMMERSAEEQREALR